MDDTAAAVRSWNDLGESERVSRQRIAAPVTSAGRPSGGRGAQAAKAYTATPPPMDRGLAPFPRLVVAWIYGYQTLTPDPPALIGGKMRPKSFAGVRLPPRISRRGRSLRRLSGSSDELGPATGPPQRAASGSRCRIAADGLPARSWREAIDDFSGFATGACGRRACIRDRSM
jgi:hypothetical protein